jgi:hypothetical protein
VFPSSSLVCGPVRLDASRSSDADGDVVAYEWRFPSGTATGQTVRHTFETAGEATVELTVRDSGGRETTTRRTLTVNDRPTVQVIVPVDAPPGQPVRLQANVTDRYGDIRGVYWRFQDGSTKAGESVTHTFRDGRRSVEVRAVDSCGAQGRTTVDVDTSPRGPAETAVDAISSGIPFVVRSAAVALLAPILFALDRRRKGRRRRRR